MVTEKSVGRTIFTTPTDREIVATRVVDAPRKVVWEAWTRPEHVPHWMTGPEGTLNTLILTEQTGKTAMTCTLLYPSKEARDAALGTDMKEGWSLSYDRLDEYLRKME